MLGQLQNIIKSQNKYYLLGTTSVNQSVEYYAMLLKSLKGEVIIEERFSMTSFKDLKAEIPVILHINGDGVISKKTSKEAGYKNSLVFGANIEDFNFYEYSQDNDVYASIVRKSFVEDVLFELGKSNLTVVHLTIGPFVIANLLSMLKGERSVYLCDYIVEVNNGKILSFSNDGVALETQEINGENLSFREIPLMASMLDYIHPNESISFNNEMVASNREDYKFKKLFKISGVSMLIFIMAALFIGHFLKSNYSNALAEKSVEYGMYEQTVAKIKSLQQEKELKERILMTSGINNENFLVKYVSEIGNTVPGDIKLISISVMSPEKKIRAEKKVGLSLNTIDITGETSNDDSFNEWMDKLRGVDWVKAVNIEYREDQKVNNTFTLKLKI